MRKQQKSSEENPDVLIVGAGMSGLFAAWRLLKELQPKPTVTIVEKMDQVGGRLETTFVDIMGTDGKKYTVHDEDGGMRFVPEGSGMEHLWNLINDLNTQDYKLTPVDFVMGDSNNRYYIRGKSFTEKDVKDSNNAIWATLFNLAPHEQGKNPSEILKEVMGDILEQNKCKSPTTPAEWIVFRNNCSYNDFEDNPVVMNKWGFWSILRRYGLTGECIEMLSHVLGFMGPFQEYINAGEGLQILFDFPTPAKTSFKTLANGFEALPNALKNEIKILGGKFVMEETITSLTEEDGGYVARGNHHTFKASHVILAIPKKPLKDLALRSTLLSSKGNFMKAVNSVKNMELTKIGLYFNTRWWHSNPAINLSNGPNFTDLPLGSVYTFSQFPALNKKDKINNKKDAAYNGPAAITQYTDYIRGNFWKELQHIGHMYKTDEFQNNPHGTVAASSTLVHEMMKQVKLLFGLAEDDPTVPMPVLSTYRVWGQDGYGYGYHQYKTDINDLTSVYPNIYNPVKNVYVCNESWSPEQGWVEGALIMSDVVMVKGFGLKPYASDSIDDLFPAQINWDHENSNEKQIKDQYESKIN